MDFQDNVRTILRAQFLEPEYLFLFVQHLQLPPIAQLLQDVEQYHQANIPIPAHDDDEDEEMASVCPSLHLASMHRGYII